MAELMLIVLVGLCSHVIALQLDGLRPQPPAIETAEDWIRQREH